MSGKYTTEFFVPQDIGFNAFSIAFKEFFPEGEVEQVAVRDEGDIVIDGTIPNERRDEIKLFWDKFCALHGADPEYRPSRFVGDR